MSVWVAGAALAIAGAMVMTGCATGESSAPRSTVTVYASSTTSAAASASSTPPSAGANPALAAGFRRVAAGTGLRVGIAVAPVGPNATASLLFGDRDPGVAWSTIKVPLAVAAERENGTSSSERDAIINSDNQAAEQLWASLGSDTEASAKVTAVLREGGNPNAVVPSQQLRSGFTIFGQTRWTLPDAATFAGHLPCMPGTGHVLSLMGQVAGNQQWGVEIMQIPKATAVKGGWGPGVDGAYLVRQIGVLTYRDGQQSAVAMSAVGGSMSSGTAALNALGNWLNQNIAALPRGRCR
ncbi:hypothetical protein EF294_05735 [Gordonia oryzae]|uniref:Serine hydrolase n=1 Tax=Gordonia oryzae TaxID=2487349 RepID=A0A3N4GQY8_9ACTN|nr:hypothetical protein [Gordonia oryzae]RPA65323.1 hypothetical protein EF294_05735 [Gordonia oryzae]